MKSFYYNQLPHLAPKGRCFFVTFCTYEFIPLHSNILWKENNFMEQFEDYDKLHDSNDSGIHLCKDEIAEIIKGSIFQENKVLYDVLYYCIMINVSEYSLSADLHLGFGRKWMSIVRLKCIFIIDPIIIAFLIEREVRVIFRNK